jgi:hypothetical protein
MIGEFTVYITDIIRELNSLKISTDVQIKELKKLRDEI